MRGELGEGCFWVQRAECGSGATEPDAGVVCLRERGGLEHLQTCRERPGQGRGVLGKPLAGSDWPE